MGDRVVASPQVSSTGVADPVSELLVLLRINPGVDGIKNIVQYVEDEHGDYYNLGKAVRGIIKRSLTEEEEALVKRLGANA